MAKHQAAAQPHESHTQQFLIKLPAGSLPYLNFRLPNLPTHTIYQGCIVHLGHRAMARPIIEGISRVRARKLVMLQI